MKAIILNNKSALILDILDYKRETNSSLINLQLTVNPIVRISVDSTKTFIVDTDDLEDSSKKIDNPLTNDLEDQKDVANTLAESLVGEGGIVSYYQPKTRRKERKLTKKRTENKTD